MDHPARFTLALLAIGGVVGLAALVGPAAAGTTKADAKGNCNPHRIELGGDEYVFFKKNMSCERAKRYAHRVYRSDGNNEPKHFNCRSGSNFNSGGFCKNRKADPNESFGWHPPD